MTRLPFSQGRAQCARRNECTLCSIAGYQWAKVHNNACIDGGDPASPVLDTPADLRAALT
jgi:hypothetical protein